MSALARFLGRLFGGRPGRPAAKPTRRVRATYDAAQPADLDEDHWAWTDALNANAANDPSVRKTLRERSRYECANNGYAGGLVRKLGNDLIGTCPRLQLAIPGVDRAIARRIEKAFARWARRINLGQKLRLLDNAAVRDGEGFAILTNNPALPLDGVQLDLRLYETDQVDTPWVDFGDPLAFPGGRLDDFGNVVEWHFLKSHPGSNVWLSNSLDYDAIPAASVVHWHAPNRPGELRGVPEILSSLTLYAYLRRYTLATVCAAETAASIAGVLETDNVNPDAADDPAANGVVAMDKVPIPRGSLLTAPAGWKAKGFDYTQPNTGYKEFKGELLTEAGSPVGAPRNLSTNSSAEYNYSSGRLDHGIYQRGIYVRRSDIAEPALDRVLAAWLDEAALVPGLIPDGLPLRNEWTAAWYFDGFSSLDPQKEAAARQTNLATGIATLAEICAEDGRDWEEVVEQQAREKQRREELGLTPPAAPPQPQGAPDAGDPAEAAAV